MKCYEFNCDKIVNGMEVTANNKYGKIVFLGIDNQKSKSLKISLDRHNPAVVKEGRMTDAWPRVVFTNEKLSFTVFQKPLRASQDILLRINTAKPSVELLKDNLETEAKEEKENPETMINGSWRVNQGEPETIFTSNGRRKLTRFCDDIIKLAPGDSIIVNLEGDNQEYEVKNKSGKIECSEVVQEAEEALA
jgi:hypothetical protein